MEELIRVNCFYCDKTWGLKNEVLQGYEDLFLNYLNLNSKKMF